MLLERNKDNKSTRARRTAGQLYTSVANLVQRVVTLRWRCARGTRRADDGRAMDAFRKRWEQPGFVRVSADGAEATVVYFMRASTRERWRNGRPFRNQQYAPPDALPPGAVSIYIAGACPARKKHEPPPPAGYGCNMVTAAEGQFLRAVGRSSQAPLRACAPMCAPRPNIWRRSSR